jgi:hypothetical protein
MDWRMFSNTVQKVEATTTGPFGGTTLILSPEENEVVWKRRLSGYRVPVIEEIPVEEKHVPLISIVIFLVGGAILAVSVIRKRRLVFRPVMQVVFALGFVLYPFVTYPLNSPWVSRWALSPQRNTLILEGLLTNVYRAFDVRDESRVYDRLAVSVTGDQLSRIYLENRKSMELENRGGARANVVEVTVLSVDGVKQAEKGGFIADAHWKVSGSVNHFGHTHYRQNRYHALVTFAAVGGSWKIRDIELIDEKRLL